jgi:hypothetical protein
MADEAIELFIHSQGNKPKVVEAGLHDVLREILLREELIIDGDKDSLVFVGESEEALQEPVGLEDGEDGHSPVDISMTIEVLELHRHHHVHVHKCRRVAVEVQFNGRTKRHRFSPATTIAVVTRWARRKFELDGAAGADYILQICGTTRKPRASEHLGELVAQPACAICFNLVKEINPQG